MINKIAEEEILSSLVIAQEAAEQLLLFSKSDNAFMQFLKVSLELGRMMNGLRSIMIVEKKYHKSTIYLNNALASLKNLQWLSKNKIFDTFIKIKFELIPLLEEVYYEFYIASKINGNLEKEYKFFFEEHHAFVGNQHINNYLKTGKYPYDLSISVIAYNHLDYTKMCVDNILKYIPDNINYELVLINHGSKDGTKEYFESICPTKQIDLAENLPGTNIASKVIEGKYWCYISNDVIVTENAIKNMMTCLLSNDIIAAVVPTTPNISNLQSIPSEYENLEQMFTWAKKNNVCNPFRWEQRTRLCNPVGLLKSDVVSSQGEFWKVKLLNDRMAYPDDGMSALFRRSGKKMILAKDAYCYHYGSVTIGRGKNSSAAYSEGRQVFQKLFSIDPWGKGFCYDEALISMLRFQETEAVNILGINCGIGSNPLKIKEKLKEALYNNNVRIYNITSERQYQEDLQGISDITVDYQNPINSEKIYPNIKFNYIIVEGFEGIANISSFQKQLMKHLEKSGQLVILDYVQGADKLINSKLYKGSKWGYFERKGDE